MYICIYTMHMCHSCGFKMFPGPGYLRIYICIYAYICMYVYIYIYI